MKKYHRYMSQVAGFDRWLREVGNRRKVSMAARGALYEIYWQMNESGWPDVLEIGTEELADLVGTTRKTFGALIVELDQAGLVEQVAGRGRKPNGYRVRAFEPLEIEPEKRKAEKVGLAVVRLVWMELGEPWNDFNEGILARIFRKTDGERLITEMLALFKEGRLRASELESRSFYSPEHFGEGRAKRGKYGGRKPDRQDGGATQGARDRDFNVAARRRGEAASGDVEGLQPGD